MTADAKRPARPAEPAVECLAIVGVGLIGGSIAAAVKAGGLAQKVWGVGRQMERLRQAQQSGLVDAVTVDLAEAARAADLLIFCTPVDRIVAQVLEAAPHCRAGTLLTDAGSVKTAICRQLQQVPWPAGVEFVGGHPLAGSEKSGFEAARPDLFVNRVCVVTPVAGSSDAGVSRLRTFWEGLGAKTLVMGAEEHDRAVAQTSHVPHVVAAALAATLQDEHRPLAATGFRDTTRIAAGDAELWTAILLQNAEPVSTSLQRYLNHLLEFQHAISSRDATQLERLLRTAKQAREQL